MQLSARETAAEPLPADLMPANVSFVLPDSAFDHRRGAFAGRVPAKFPTSPIQPTPAAGNAARASHARRAVRVVRNKAPFAAPGRICPHERP